MTRFRNSKFLVALYFLSSKITTLHLIGSNACGDVKSVSGCSVSCSFTNILYDHLDGDTVGDNSTAEFRAHEFSDNYIHDGWGAPTSTSHKPS